MNGEERIRIYLNRAFSGTLQTDAVSEAKESLFADLREKYTSLVSQGQSEEAAYQSVISGIGESLNWLTVFRKTVARLPFSLNPGLFQLSPNCGTIFHLLLQVSFFFFF